MTFVLLYIFLCIVLEGLYLPHIIPSYFLDNNIEEAQLILITPDLFRELCPQIGSRITIAQKIIELQKQKEVNCVCLEWKYFKTPLKFNWFTYFWIIYGVQYKSSAPLPYHRYILKYLKYILDDVLPTFHLIRFIETKI